ncbi:MAG: class I SAM-dependent methyltransferase [Halobacteriota archaeon]
MTPLSTHRDDGLERCLKQIDELFDVQEILDQTLEREHIVHYYLTNKLSQLLWSSEGFFHYGISYDGQFKRDDLREHARIVERYIRDSGASKVLELAYGLGPNIAFLARRNPDIMFEAIDISNKPLLRYTSSRNLHFRFCDFHNLSALHTSYDVIFIIEGLSCSIDKAQVFREVKKKLTPGGIFIVFDGYERPRTTPLSQSEGLMWGLIEKSLSCNKIERVDDVEGYMREEYSIEAAQDLTAYIFPSVMRFRPFIRFYFNHPVFARTLNRCIPFDAVKNTIHLLLLPISIRRQIGCYYMHVLINDP